LACCLGSPVCRGCGIKHVTGSGARSCWQCGRPGALSAHLLADELLRGAVLFAKENGGQHCKDTLRELLQRKIRCLQQLAAGDKPRDDASINGNDSVIADDVVVIGGESDNDELRGSTNVDLRHKISSKKRDRTRDEDRRTRDSRRERDRERDRDRERKRERERERNYSEAKASEESSSPQKGRQEKKAVVSQNGGGVGAVPVGSFAALQRRIREEHETVERLVAERIEAHIAAMVADQLRLRKDTIHAEVLAKLALARQNMEAELELELELKRKFRAAEQAQRLAELEARMAEAERQVAEEQRRLAEERLAILENQASV
jgi:Arginine and glutamate-rich 1